MHVLRAPTRGCRGDSGTAIAAGPPDREQRLDERRARLDQERDGGSGRDRQRGGAPVELAVGQAGLTAVGGDGHRVGRVGAEAREQRRRGVRRGAQQPRESEIS